MKIKVYLILCIILMATCIYAQNNRGAEFVPILNIGYNKFMGAFVYNVPVEPKLINKNKIRNYSIRCYTTGNKFVGNAKVDAIYNITPEDIQKPGIVYSKAPGTYFNYLYNRTDALLDMKQHSENNYDILGIGGNHNLFPIKPQILNNNDPECIKMLTEFLNSQDIKVIAYPNMIYKVDLDNSNTDEIIMQVSLTETLKKTTYTHYNMIILFTQDKDKTEGNILRSYYNTYSYNKLSIWGIMDIDGDGNLEVITLAEEGNNIPEYNFYSYINGKIFNLNYQNKNYWWD